MSADRHTHTDTHTAIHVLQLVSSTGNIPVKVLLLSLVAATLMTPTTKTSFWLEARSHAEKTSVVDQISRLFDKFASALLLPRVHSHASLHHRLASAPQYNGHGRYTRCQPQAAFVLA